MHAWVKPVLFLLFIILIVTSYMVGYLLGNKTIEPTGQIIDTIVLSPDEDDYTKVPIHISGNLKNNDNKPYANHTVQLHSKVREVRTDSQGRFMFEHVELGDHKLILLDNNKNVIMEKKILFKRTKNYGEVDFPDEGSDYFVIHVGRDVKLLDCSLSIDEKTGNLVVDKDKTVVLTHDGSMITSKGSSNSSAGVLVTPSGIVVTPDGTIISPTGQIILPDNTIQTVGEEGHTTSDGTKVSADGTVLLTNGTTVSKDGVITTPDGKTQKVSEGGNTISDGTDGVKVEEVVSKYNNKPNSSSETNNNTIKPGEATPETNKVEDDKTTGGTNKPPNKDTPNQDGNKKPPNKDDTKTEDNKEENTNKPDDTTTAPPSTQEPKPEEPSTEEPPIDPQPPIIGPGGGGGGPVIPDTQSEPIEAFEGNESWKNLAYISLFSNPDGSDSVIMPGSKGLYIFRLKNANTFDLSYSLSVDDSQNYKFKLPLVYRLKRGDEYLGGKQWMKPGQLKDVDVELEKEGDVYYTLEWLWPFESGNDAKDTSIGMLSEEDRKYIVTLTILAQEK